jgi:hypothetical protein
MNLKNIILSEKFLYKRAHSAEIPFIQSLRTGCSNLWRKNNVCSGLPCLQRASEYISLSFTITLSILSLFQMREKNIFRR